MLSDLVLMFAGPVSQTHCFLHIVNLIVKSLLCQFDTMTKNGMDTQAGSELEEEELCETEENNVEDEDEGDNRSDDDNDED